MSETLKLDPKRLIVYYSPNVLSIIAGGKHRRFFADQVGDEKLQYIHNLVKNFKAGDQEAGEELAKHIDPNYRDKINEDLVADMQGNYYLNELPHHQLPKAVKDMLDQYRERGLSIEPIVNLWKLALDNPSEQARADLMTYIEKFGVPVTDSGYMILYKSVRDKNEVIEKLAYVVGESFFTVRQQGLDPSDFNVFEIPDKIREETGLGRFRIDRKEHLEFTTVGYEEDEWGDEEEVITEHVVTPIDSLDNLFRELVLNKQDVDPDEEEKEPIWEPYHRGDHGMTIKLGEVTTMPREKCDPDINVECSYGLHVGSYEYVYAFQRSDGSVLACLVNPRDIVALPKYDNSKIRTCAYMPYGVIKRGEDGDWEEAETSYWEEDFIDYEKEVLESRIQELNESMQSSDNPRERVKMEELSALLQKRLVNLDS